MSCTFFRVIFGSLLLEVLRACFGCFLSDLKLFGMTKLVKQFKR